MKTLEEQQITKKKEATESESRDYADRVLKEYEPDIKKIVNSKFKGDTHVSEQDREDIFIDVCYTLWATIGSGEFREKHGRASIIKYIFTVTKSKKNKLLKRIIADRKALQYAPPEYDTKPDGSSQDKSEPWIENFGYPNPPPWGSPERRHEEKRRDEFITKETKYPEIIDSCRKGYSIQVIARTYGLNDEQVKKRIYREKKRLSKTAKQQGWYYGDLKKLK